MFQIVLNDIKNLISNLKTDTTDTKTLLTSLDTLSKQSLGKFGCVVTLDTAAITGTFASLYTLETTVFSLLTITGATGSLVGLTIPEGRFIYGNITAYTLTSGKVIAYKSS